MIKRLFDLITAILLLTLTLPLFLVIAILIKLDSPGPIVYRSKRVGRNGKHFGLVRFRTVDIHKPDNLPMSARLTAVGRFIRNYSLDDLPNLISVFNGEMSIVGPRPTEPERVDLSDPAWQQILTVKPGIFSPAILKLARTYNDSDLIIKNKIELEYVKEQSSGLDLRLFVKGLKDTIASRGNVKARGRPDPTLPKQAND